MGAGVFYLHDLQPQPGERKGMDLFELLKRDHEEMMSLLQRLIAKPEPNMEGVRDLQETLANLLVNHTRMEEQFLYARLQNILPAREMIRHSYEEHSRALQTMQNIQRNRMGSDAWVELCQSLLAELAPHVRLEERELFSIIKGELEMTEIEQIYQQMMTFRREELTIPEDQSV
jgi:iron-sulfur cluster repair protein YtfE (RIC family)